MAVTVRFFIALLMAVGILRVVELGLSRHNQVRLLKQGAKKIHEPDFCWMVVTHSVILAGAALEVILLRRPFIPLLAAAACGFFLAANAMRWWVIRTLKACWTVQVMDSTEIGIITNGPFRFIRHPNYVAVFFELLFLPLIHTAWITALIGSAAHVWVLSRRLAVEEPMLMASGIYREKMAHKPRFLPGLF